VKRNPYGINVWLRPSLLAGYICDWSQALALLLLLLLLCELCLFVDSSPMYIIPDRNKQDFTRTADYVRRNALHTDSVYVHP